MVEGSVEKQRDNNIGGITGKGFVPGKSGNPGGRPRGKSITARIRRLLDKKSPTGEQYADILAEEIIKLAVKGNSTALTELLNRIEGKVKDELDVTEIQKIEYVPAKEKEDV